MAETAPEGGLRQGQDDLQEIPMITKLTVERLFNSLSFEVEIRKEEITILTGPNGYGKTTVLRIIHALASNDLVFFFQLPFSGIMITAGDDSISLSKSRGTITIESSNDKPKKFDIETILSNEDFADLMESQEISRIDINRWKYFRGIEEYTNEEVLNRLNLRHKEILNSKLFQVDFLKSVDVYFIETQRLIKKRMVRRRILRRPEPPSRLEEKLSHTIEDYIENTSRSINNVLAKASKVSQELDSSFPARLFKEESFISESDFNSRYENIKDIQRSLSRYGLSTATEGHQPIYKKENAKALSVYLNDTEKKLSVYDDMLKQFDIFSSLVSRRDFVSKTLEIGPEYGMRFITKDGESIPPAHLSSGEQQEVVLFYDLLFNVQPGSLVLIDEPEISLHVVWQKEFLSDLMSIIDLKKLTVIVATHSPQIIGESWDKVIDLADASETVLHEHPRQP